MAKTVADSRVSATGTFTRTNGTTSSINDVNFAINQRDTVWMDDRTIDAAFLVGNGVVSPCATVH